MRIEDVSVENLANRNDSDLWKTRFRFVQVWDKHFAKNSDAVVGALNREDILEKYAILSEVITKRGKQIHTSNIDRALCRSKLQKRSEKEQPLKLLVKEGDEHIVMSIVYEPEEVDTQGEISSVDEIRKAAYYYMENSQVVKMNHKGNRINASVLENYLAPQELTIAGRVIKAGTWLMTLRINDEYIWKKIKDGELTGFSMAGFTHRSPAN